ncbi:MAG: zinc ABC transporter solute-binding protein [Phycisphaerales bacterium]|nr:zinc ABC transporter solute-binding protein [Phycisphaerales bacterium]
MYVERARDGFIAIDPAHESLYRQRADDYLAQLEELHGWVKNQVERIPRNQRVIITSHDAFAYFGKAYGVDVHAVVGISTEQAPKPQDVQRLEAMVKDKGIHALFIETSVTQTLNDMVRKVAENTSARIGGTLYSDSLGGSDTPASTYIGMVRHNVTTMVEALK